MGAVTRQAPALLLALLFGVTTTGSPEAQQATGDQRMRFGIDTRVGANDNLDLDPTSSGTTTYWDTKLSFGFLSQTPLQTFSFDASGVLRAKDAPVTGFETGFRDPTLDLLYQRQTLNSRLTLDAAFAQPDLSFVDPFSGDQVVDTDLVQSGGELTDLNVGAKLETGLSAPLGFELGVRTHDLNYTNTTDLALFDNRTDTVETAVIFRFSQATSLRASAFYETYSAQDSINTDRETRDARLTLDHQIDPITRVSANMGYSRIETDDTAGFTVDNGIVAGVTLDREMPNGTFSAILDGALTEAGRQNTLRVLRAIDMPRGQFSFGIGVTDVEGFSPRAIGSIDYRIGTQTGTFTASLSHDMVISATEGQAESTVLAGLAYSMNINDLSSLAVGVNYADIDTLGQGTDRELASFNITYRRDVTQDWDMLVGYTHTYSDESIASGPARSNEIFFSLQRNIDFYR